MSHLRPVPTVAPRVTMGAQTNDIARRVCLMHETARVAEHTPLAPTNDERLATLVETAGYGAAAVRDRDDQELRKVLLAASVQIQLWITQLDQDHAA